MLFVDRLLRDEAAVQRPGEKNFRFPSKCSLGCKLSTLEMAVPLVAFSRGHVGL